MIFRRFEDVCCWFLHSICWMSTILILSVYLTYWPTKCVTCFSPHDENFHQMWSWYDCLLPSYSVLAAYTLRDLMTRTCLPNKCNCHSIYTRELMQNMTNLPFICSMAVLYGCNNVVGTSCEKQLSSENCWKCFTKLYKFNTNMLF